MEQDTPPIPELIRQTLSEPRRAANRILEMDLPASALWQSLVLVVILSVLAAKVTALITGVEPATGAEMLMAGFTANPLMLGFVQGALLVVVVFSVHWIGRSMGGLGTFEGALALVTWLQFLLVCLQVAQGLAALILPPLAGLIGLAGIVIFFWLLTQFVCQLHGFRNPGMVFVMILISMLGVVFAMSMLLAVFGAIFLGEVPNV